MEETSELHSETETTTAWLETQPHVWDDHISWADEVIFFYKLFVGIIALFGNITNIVVIQYTKVHKTTRIIISILAVSDLCYVLIYSPSIIYPKFFRLSYVDHTNFTCQLSTFGSLFFAFVSGLMVAVLTVERVVAVTLPLHAKRFLTVKKLLCGISLFILVDFVVSGFITFQFLIHDFHNENNTLLYSMCYHEVFTDILPYFGVMLNMITPLIVIVLGNMVIVVTVLVKRKQISGMISGYHPGEMRLVMTTVSISLCSIIFTTPVALYYTLGEKIVGHELYVDWTNPYYLSCDALYYTNFAINFFLYMAFTSSFRNEVGVVVKSCVRRCRSAPVVERNEPNESVSTGTTSSSSLSLVTRRHEQLTVFVE